MRLRGSSRVQKQGHKAFFALLFSLVFSPFAHAHKDGDGHAHSEPNKRSPQARQQPKQKQGTSQPAAKPRRRTPTQPGRKLKKVTASKKKTATPKSKKQSTSELDTIVVTGTRSRRRVSDTPVKTEVIRAEKIAAKGARNLVEALSFEPGVRLDNQCSVCNTTGIRLSGLPGRYLLVLIDGMPVYSSLGLTYGLLQIDTLNIKQVEIVKGANSVLYGTDAISGVINIITKTPKAGGEGGALLELGSFGSWRFGGYGGFRKGPFALSLTASFTKHDRVDRDGDQVSEYTAFDRLNAALAMRYRFTSRTSLMIRMSFMQEQRLGGASTGSLLEIQSDFNPNADPTKGDRFGRRGLSETILSRRWGGGFQLEHRVGQFLRMITTATAVSHFQDSDYEGDVYVGDQIVFFAQQVFQWNILNRVLLNTGVTYRYEGLDENRAISEYQYHLPGVFAQAEWLATNWLELVGGLRYDWHNVFGHVVTPRLAFKIAPLRWLTFRGVWGTGFRAPSTFYEYAHGARPQGYQQINDANSPERSMSANASVSITPGSWLNVTLEGAWNRITDPITFEVVEQANDRAVAGDVRIFNSPGELQIFSFEAQVQSSPLSWLQLSAGYGFYEYINQDVLVSAAPRHHITFGIDARIPIIQTRISLQGEVFLPMDLEGVYGKGYNIQGTPSLERWLNPANADLNNPKLNTSPTYSLVNLRIEQSLAPLLRLWKIKTGVDVSLYFGIENLFDFHQSDIDGPIYFPDQNGRAGAADIIHIWGPMRGRFFYGGIKVNTL